MNMLGVLEYFFRPLILIFLFYQYLETKLHSLKIAHFTFHKDMPIEIIITIWQLMQQLLWYGLVYILCEEVHAYFFHYSRNIWAKLDDFLDFHGYNTATFMNMLKVLEYFFRTLSWHLFYFFYYQYLETKIHWLIIAYFTFHKDKP